MEQGDFIEKLYCSELKKLIRAANLKLRNYQTAEDMAQDVFVLAQEKREALMSHPEPERWLLNVLRKKLMHEFRARSKFMGALIELEARARSEEFADNEFKSELFDCLTEEEIEMLKLIWVDGYTIRMVAEKLGIKYETCRRRIQRAKDKIRDCEK